MVILSTFVCAYCRSFAPTHGELCKRCHTEESRWTAEAVEAVVERQRKTMPDSRVEDYKPVTARAVRVRPTTNYDLPEAYEGTESTVLEPLIVSGHGGFTRALMQADKFLRTPDGRDCRRATANRDQTEVTLHFARGRRQVFACDPPAVSVKRDENREAAERRMLLVRYLGDSDEPQYLTAIVSALRIEADACRYLLKTSKWFVCYKGRDRQHTRYGLTALGRARLAMQIASPKREAVPA